LSLTPESQPFQSQVLNAAKSLSSSFNQLSDQAQTTRLDADAQIAKQVDFVNQTLKQIEKLNGQILLANVGNQDASALEDQRKTMIDEVSGVIHVREILRGNGEKASSCWRHRRRKSHSPEQIALHPAEL